MFRHHIRQSIQTIFRCALCKRALLLMFSRQLFSPNLLERRLWVGTCLSISFLYASSEIVIFSTVPYSAFFLTRKWNIFFSLWKKKTFSKFNQSNIHYDNNILRNKILQCFPKYQHSVNEIKYTICHKETCRTCEMSDIFYISSHRAFKGST